MRRSAASPSIRTDPVVCTAALPVADTLMSLPEIMSMIPADWIDAEPTTNEAVSVTCPASEPATMSTDSPDMVNPAPALTVIESANAKDPD